MMMIKLCKLFLLTLIILIQIALSGPKAYAEITLLEAECISTVSQLGGESDNVEFKFTPRSKVIESHGVNVADIIRVSEIHKSVCDDNPGEPILQKVAGKCYQKYVSTLLLNKRQYKINKDLFFAANFVENYESKKIHLFEEFLIPFKTLNGLEKGSSFIAHYKIGRLNDDGEKILGNETDYSCTAIDLF